MSLTIRRLFLILGMTSRTACFHNNFCNAYIIRRVCCFASLSSTDASSPHQDIPITSTTTVDDLSGALESALRHDDGSGTGLSPHLVRGLLMQSKDNHVDMPTCTDSSRFEQGSRNDDDDQDNYSHDNSEEPILRGLPQRPFYRELSKRLLLLISFGENHKGNPTSPTLLINAKEMNLSPELSITSIPPPPEYCSPSACSEWFRTAGDTGVLRLLGLRHTVGTEVGVLPPDVSTLLQASRVPHRQNAPPHDSLTVAARARCKHAHRGRDDNFFGTPTGGTKKKNAAADEVILRILRNAAWINIHIFSGMEIPTLEVRVPAGYGARWTMNWPSESDYATDVVFRGFLEPQMVDGHEKNWRH